MSIHSGWKTLLMFSLVALGACSSTRESPPKTKPRVLVTISKETTYITEPLRSDGYPDYFASLNERMSKGVTPENNAAVPFWKAMGPSRIEKEHRKKHFQMLGILPLPEKGDYFVTLDDYDKRQGKKDAKATATVTESRYKALSNQLGVLMERPWSKQEFPFWAGWLAVNEKPLKLLVEACQRPRRFEPLIPDDDSVGLLMMARLPGAQQSRDCARSLAIRATLRLQEGKVNEAWSDLLACHRVSRLAGQGATFVDGLLSYTYNWNADAGDRALLQHAKLTAGQIAKMRADLDGLPPMVTMSDKCDAAERFMVLDCLLTIARDGPSCLDKVVDDCGESKNTDIEKLKSQIGSLPPLFPKWDRALRIGNSMFDQFVAAYRTPTRAGRLKALARAEESVRQKMKAAVKAEGDLLRVLEAKQKDGSDWSLLHKANRALFDKLSKTLSEGVFRILVCILQPDWLKAENAEDQTLMEWKLTQLAFVLAAYHVDHDSYPAKLADLVPKYVEEVPKDVFNNDADLHYGRKGDGYLLYSVGVNGKDDGGKGRDDTKNDEDWDDLAVRMSPARP